MKGKAKGPNDAATDADRALLDATARLAGQAKVLVKGGVRARVTVRAATAEVLAARVNLAAGLEKDRAVDRSERGASVQTVARAASRRRHCPRST